MAEPTVVKNADFLKSRKRRYPFDTLAIGDAFSVKDVRKYASLRSAASRFGRVNKMTFAVLKRGREIWVKRTA